MTRRRSYAEGMTYGALSFGSMAGLSIVSSIVTARIYGIHVLGEFALVTAAATAVQLVSSARERPAFIREIATLEARAPRITGLFYAVFGFSIVLTLVVGGLLAVATHLVFSGPIDRPDLVAPALVNMAVYIVFVNTAGNLDCVLTAFRAGRQLFWLRITQALLLFAVAVWLGLTTGNVWSLVIANGVACAVTVFWRVAIIGRYMRLRVDRAELRSGIRTLPEIIRFGLKIAPGGLADGVSQEVGTWYLGVVSNISVVGAYSRAWLISRQLMVLNGRVTEMLFPTLVERRHAGDHAGFDRALVDTLRYCAAGLFLIGAVGGGAAVGIMNLFGPGFSAAADALVLALLVPGLFTLVMVQRHALYAIDRPVLATTSALLRCGVTVAATLALTIPFGAAGAAGAVCLGLVVDLGFATSRLLPRLVTPFAQLWTPRAMIGIVAAFAAGFASARAIDSWIGGLLGLAGALTAGTVAYVAVLVAIGGFAERDRDRALRLTARFRRPEVVA